jgi:hypothetical protein
MTIVQGEQARKQSTKLEKMSAYHDRNSNIAKNLKKNRTENNRERPFLSNAKRVPMDTDAGARNEEKNFSKKKLVGVFFFALKGRCKE